MRESREAEALKKAYDEKDAEKMIQTCGPELDMPTGMKDLAALRKGDERKALMATLIRWRTSASTEWIAKGLQMENPNSASRQAGILNKGEKLKKRLNAHELASHPDILRHS